MENNKGAAMNAAPLKITRLPLDSLGAG